MEKYFKGFTAIHIPRSQNDEADKLAKAAARKEPLPPDVFYEKITKPSTKQEKAKQINAITSEDWRSPIMAYLRGHFEPTDEKEGKRMFQRARSYTLSEGELYKSGVVAPLAQVHNDGRRPGTTEENTFRTLRIPHWHKTSGRQSLQARILLAICIERC